MTMAIYGLGDAPFRVAVANPSVGWIRDTNRPEDRPALREHPLSVIEVTRNRRSSWVKKANEKNSQVLF